jgi:prepilin-type N-terminal cleavage/methylation domain-containing protein
MTRQATQSGFTLVEILVVLAIIAVISVTALPNVFRTTEDQRLKNDGRSIAQMIGVTKMRAASRFSRARLFADLDTNSFFVQVWDKPTNSWVSEGGTIRLSQGVNFGFGGLGAPPANTQVVISQSPLCQAMDGSVATIANSACIVFNSRGIPVDNVGAPTGSNAIYLTNGVGVFATTLTATPLVRLWWSPANVVAWVRQ